MHRVKGSMPTPEPSRYLTRLCHHFRRKIEVEYDERQGLARFPWGDCRLTAREGELEFECSSATAEQLGRVRFVIDEHVALFSRRAPLTVHWQPPDPD
ncbi:DUF2218 domain-containing protein [Pseudothauera rhizosphaerae]|uniref:DUF2218 domain-containing protein n=1 Tax=Pseudothauera rhizosphaerae TaxID=2565932 RepID=A0A4S4A9T8_9RHOO|nr:DUF2218 domain-containing protein [Pseudothauera rhizosphaerae]THF55632.1 DUF2218 domain-containing protein [Pseudothauera rhizosphaerae]